MGYRPTVTEVARNFADYINRVAFGGERFTLMRGRKAVAELVPVPSGLRLGELPELLASLPHLDPADADRFASEMADAHADLGRHTMRDPWES
jgi:antitoxin (DNA-binding transcriptional repressor) of toxin-antitoxin stability system